MLFKTNENIISKLYKKIKANVETLNFSAISRQLEIWAK